MKARALIALVTIVSAAAAVPAAAQDDVPPAGRFQLAPGEDSSFVRLDTRTGAISHCRQDNDVWHCRPIMDSALTDRLAALSDKVDRLSSKVDDLSSRVDELAVGASAPVPAPLAKAPSPAHRKPTGIAPTAVYRLLEMIRTLKHGRADAS